MGFIRNGNRGGSESCHGCPSIELIMRLGDWIWGTEGNFVFEIVSLLNLYKYHMLNPYNVTCIYVISEMTTWH